MESPTVVNFGLPQPDFMADLRRFSIQKALSMLVDDYACFSTCVKPDEVDTHMDIVFSTDPKIRHGFLISYSGTHNGAFTVNFMPMTYTDVTNMCKAEKFYED